MPESGIDNREHFVKQRRSFVLMSAFIILLAYLGLDFEKINFLGNEMDISHPERVSLVLLFLWLYFCCS